MSKIVQIKSFSEHIGEEVQIQGWMFNKRSSGKIHFLELRDGSCETQGIVSQNEVTPEIFEKAERLTMESSVKVSGIITKHPRFEDTYEMQIKDIEIIQLVCEDYPIAKK